MQSPVLHFFPFYKFLPPSDKRQQVEILQSLVLLVPEPPAFPGCLAVVLIQEPFHTVTIEEILVNVGRKNEILEMCTLQRILEEKRHRCKSTLFPLGGDGCRKQRFVMILQKIFRLKTAARYIRHTVSLALQTNRQLLQEIVQIQIHKQGCCRTSAPYARLCRG